MKTILAATDFSPAAVNAVNYAAGMAQQLQAELVLLHVYQLPVVYTEMPAAPMEIADFGEDAERKLRAVKDELAHVTSNQINITTVTKLGMFYPALEEACEERQPYLVIMGSQGTTAAERFLFGGHTVHAMKNLNWPLISVPPNAAFGQIKKAGLACDFIDVEDTVPVAKISKFLSDFGAELHVLNTGRKEQFDPELVFESGILRGLWHNPKHVYHYITAEDTDQGVIDYAGEKEIDLLIVIPKEHSLLERIFFKSHTKQMVLHSPIPVMALHY